MFSNYPPGVTGHEPHISGEWPCEGCNRHVEALWNGKCHNCAEDYDIVLNAIEDRCPPFDLWNTYHDEDGRFIVIITSSLACEDQEMNIILNQFAFQLRREFEEAGSQTQLSVRELDSSAEWRRSHPCVLSQQQ